MPSSTFLVPALYGLCVLLLAALGLVVACRGPRGCSRPRRVFALLCLFLLAWPLTLFLEARTASPDWQLALGRANFAAVPVAAHLAWRFVLAVAGRPLPTAWWPGVLTTLLALLTLLTPAVSAAEWLDARGRPTTRFGPLFPLYLAHVTGHLAAAVLLAFQESRRPGVRPRARAQLRLIGSGMLATGAVALVTNALLPYAFADFRFCDVGALSTLFFALAVGRAVFAHRLFDLKLVLKKTLVWGLLLAFVLGAHSSALLLLAHHLTDTGTPCAAGGAGRFGTLLQFAVLFIAFSLDPLRRFLEDRVDRLLFEKERRGGKAPRERRGRR